MILLHRLTSFAIAACIAAGFAVLMYTNAFGFAFLCFVLVPVLFARLLRWEVKRLAFWMFFGLPLAFLLSAIFLFLFLEGSWVKALLAISVIVGSWLYAENVFSFYHLPSTYQAYSLEYLSFVLVVMTGFYFYSSTYGIQLFLQLPGWVLSLAIFWMTLFCLLVTFWVSKIEEGMTVRLATVGALVITELFLAIGLLPTSFFANAAGLAIALYSYIGLARAHALERLSKVVVRRYILLGCVLFLLVFGTAKWI